jgi:succinate dehydrogenase / fumarate reductase membrane anchor subunit
MRLSAILLVPLVWTHSIITTLIIGAENVSLDLVAARWANIGWKTYDILLLAFAFSHGMTGLRQVLSDFATGLKARKALNIILLFFWLLLSVIGATSIIGGVGS